MKVLIVDDDYIIIKGLEKLIDWDKLNMEIFAVARDGQEALSILEKTPVDIVITDVNMPQLSGIDFVKKAREVQMYFQLIIISGYQNFDYAKSGMDLGAVNYLLKPIDKVELERTLEEVAARIVALNHENELINMNYKVNLRNWLNQSGLSMESVSRLELLRDDYIFFVVDIGSVEANKQAEVVNRIQSSYDYILIHRIDQFLLLLTLEEQQKADVEAILPDSSHIELIDNASSLVEVKRIYQQLQNSLLNYKFYYYDNNKEKMSLQSIVDFLSESYVQTFSQDMIEELSSQIQKIYKAIDTYQIQDTFMLFEEFISMIRHNKVPVAEVIQYFQSIVIYYSTKNQVDDLELYEVIHQLADDTSFQEKISIVRKIIVAARTTQREKVYSPAVQDILSHVEDSYDEDISLKQLSEDLHINVMYLGQLFKKEVGMSLSKYLNNYRIEQAKKLLTETNLAVAEIGFKVGYQNQAYFYRVFKSSENKSPKEYRNDFINQLHQKLS